MVNGISAAKSAALSAAAAVAKTTPKTTDTDITDVDLVPGGDDQ